MSSYEVNFGLHKALWCGDWLRMPMPPSLNRTYRGSMTGGHGSFLTEKARAWKAYAVTEIRRVGFTPLHGRVLLDLVMHFATNARADLDNRKKLLLDAITLSGLWHDDSQIDRITVRRGVRDPKRLGFVMVRARSVDELPLVPLEEYQQTEVKL